MLLLPLSAPPWWLSAACVAAIKSKLFNVKQSMKRGVYMFLTNEMRRKLRLQKLGIIVQAAAVMCGTMAYFALLLLLSH